MFCLGSFCSSHSYTVIIVYFFNCNSGTFFGNIIETWR